MDEETKIHTYEIYLEKGRCVVEKDMNRRHVSMKVCGRINDEPTELTLCPIEAISLAQKLLYLALKL